MSDSETLRDLAKVGDNGRIPIHEDRATLRGIADRFESLQAENERLKSENKALKMMAISGSRAMRNDISEIQALQSKLDRVEALCKERKFDRSNPSEEILDLLK